MLIEAGFLIVKTFTRLYTDYVKRYALKQAHYAIPRIDKTAEQYRIQYRGIDRDALSEYDQSNLLSEIRMSELEKAGKCEDGFLFIYSDAMDVYHYLPNEHEYEIIWTKISGSSSSWPDEYRRIGYEPSYFTGDHFSASCDCMLIPRWHGTDEPGGQLFEQYFKKLNRYGLFNTFLDTQEFLEYYLSFDWTEQGDYKIIEVGIK